MKLNLRPLMVGECDVLDIDFELAADFDTSDAKSSLYGVLFPSNITVQGKVTNNAGYMRITLTLRAPYTAQCARCLDSVDGVFEYTFEKTVAPERLIETVDENRRDDFLLIGDNNTLDIDEYLLELFELEFPNKLLCREDCQGLCPKCGKNLNEGKCTCEMREIDPRLLPLMNLLKDNQDKK